jgi:quercetin dioxygenase-like cupin family protein
MAEERGIELMEEFRGTSLVFHERGDDEHPQLFELRFEPGSEVSVHAHQQDEIFYVVAGSMKLGNREIGPGSSVFVGGNTLYSFGAGSDGLQVLNFRPRFDQSHISPAEHAEARAAVR